MKTVDATDMVAKLCDSFRDGRDLLQEVVNVRRYSYDEDHLARRAYDDLADRAETLLARWANE